MSTSKSNNYEKILLRLNLAVEALGLNKSQVAERIGYSKGQTGWVLTGKAPVTDRFITIFCAGLNISESWIRHEEGPMQPGHGVNRESENTHTTASDPFDWDLHNEIATMIGEAQEKLNIRVKPEKLGGLIQMIYQDFLAGHQVSPAKVHQLVRLAA